MKQPPFGSFAGGTHAIGGIVSGARHAGSLKPLVESSLPPPIAGAFAKFDEGKAALESPDVPLFAAAGVAR